MLSNKCPVGSEQQAEQKLHNKQYNWTSTISLQQQSIPVSMLIKEVTWNSRASPIHQLENADDGVHSTYQDA